MSEEATTHTFEVTQQDVEKAGLRRTHTVLSVLSVARSESVR